MIVLVHATGDFPDLQVLSPLWADIEVYAMAAQQEFVSQLYRQPDAIGILDCHIPDFAPQIVRGLRDGNVENRLIVLLHERGGHGYRVAVRAQTLMSGADDAQPREIDLRELVARLRALEVRTRAADELISIPPIGKFDPAAQKVYADGVVIHLTGRESAMLELLAGRPGALFSKSACIQAMYQERDEPQVKILDVFLGKLRRKLKPICGDFDPIETVWGQGIRFREWSTAA